MTKKLLILIVFSGIFGISCYAQKATEPTMSRASAKPAAGNTSLVQNNGSKPEMKRMEVKPIANTGSENKTEKQQVKGVPTLSRANVSKVVAPETK